MTFSVSKANPNGTLLPPPALRRKISVVL